MAMREVSGLSVSPDGTKVAFQLQSADVSRNSYRSVWCVMDTLPGAPVLTIGDGGEIALPSSLGTLRRTGVWQTLQARWSPDMQWVGFLAKRDSLTRVEICRANGSECRVVGASDSDVSDFTWDDNGAGLILARVPSRRQIEALLDEEGATGFRVDHRFDLFYSTRPTRFQAPEPAMFYVNFTNGLERPATSEEHTYFAESRRRPAWSIVGTSRSITVTATGESSPPPVVATRDVRAWERSGNNGAIWTEPADAAFSGERPPLSLFMTAQDGSSAPLRCVDPVCIGYIEEFAPTLDGEAVIFLRRSGWGLSQQTMGYWRPATGEVREILTTNDAIGTCSALELRAICFHEGPTSPRRVVSIDLRSGEVATLFDPNPHVPPSALLPAIKVEWTSPEGDEVFGYLVLPERRDESEPLPLVVVQYRARGFLRGGTGDEYPIQALARHGLAVLAFERPDDLSMLARIRDPNERVRMEWHDLHERRSVLSALMSGIDQLVANGIVDPNRIGMSGLSDGAETTSFALIHCRCLAAAAISANFHEPTAFYLLSETSRRTMRAEGRGPDEAAFWDDLSLAANVYRVQTPILMQIADRELLFSAETYGEFSYLGRSLELYVFPDEYHIKWQPQHRMAIYQRNVDWFLFWLLGREDRIRDAPHQYERWRALRDQ